MNVTLYFMRDYTHIYIYATYYVHTLLYTYIHILFVILELILNPAR